MTNNSFINRDIKDESSFLEQKRYKIKQVKKRDGRIVEFDKYRIYYAVERAMRATGKYNKEILEKITDYIVKVLEEKYDEKIIPSVEEIQDIVELALLKFDLYEVAKAYISYRKEKEKIRQEKINLLGEFYEEEVAKKFSINSIRLMVNRYLLRDENKNIIEGPKQMFERIAALIVIPDILYDEKIYDKNGKQSIKPYEEFKPEEWEGKVGLIKDNDKFKLKWNKYHLERMKYLYDYLNKKGNMKVSWSELVKMLQDGELDKYYENYLNYFDLMASKRFMPNSPTLFNAGARLGQLSACFVLDIDDDMESIMRSARDAALIFKSGGGIGINYSKLRPEGDVVASTGGVASGPVSFMKIIDTITDVVKQGGKRRGANMGVLESWHADILKFVHAKEKEGILENFNISVMIEPGFWKYFEENKPYPLLNNRVLKKHNTSLPGDPNFDYNNIPKDAIVSYIDPNQLLSEISYVAWEKADPGCLFMDNINKRNMQYKFRGPIRATNPCVVGDTRILTPFGYIKIEDLFKLAKIDSKDILYSLDISKGGEKFAYLTNILVPEENVIYANTKERSISYSNLQIKPGYVWKVGYKKVYKVTFDEGLEIEATGDHRIVTENGWKRVLDLKSGDKIKVARMDIDNIDDYGLKEYRGIKLDYNLGFSVGKNVKENIPEIVYYANSEFVKGFIYGLFSSKGFIDNEKIKISDNIKLLKEIQKILLLFGILSKIYSEGNKYTLYIDNYELFVKKIQYGLKENLSEDLYIVVKSVEYTGEKIVYDMTVPEEHMYITNGSISHNCGEQPLYPYESCNLGSINLYAMIDFKDGKAEFNWDKYIETIKWAYRFLDNVIDVNKYPIPEIEEASKAVRRVGVGYMGLADALFALEIPYSSEEGFKFVMRATEYLTYYSMLESIERAKTRGIFPKYNETTYKDGELPIEGFYHRELWSLDWDLIAKLIKDNGIRNVEVSSIAPTGSISMLADTSSGIEPQYALAYEKRVTAGVYYYVDPELERQLKEKGLYNDDILKKISDNGGSLLGISEIPDDLKKVFLTSLDIPWWDHVRTQAVAQLWITTSISKTINMPSWVTPEDVLGSYVFAYRTGCKGITIYREGSKSVQVYYAPAEVGKNRMKDYIRLIKEGKIENKTLELLKEFGIKIPIWYYELGEDQKENNIKNVKINLNIEYNGEKNDIKVEKCPVCGSTRLKHQGGCVTCMDCSWSECILA